MLEVISLVLILQAPVPLLTAIIVDIGSYTLGAEDCSLRKCKQAS